MSTGNREVVHEGWLIKSPPTKRILRAVCICFDIFCTQLLNIFVINTYNKYQESNKICICYFRDGEEDTSHYGIQVNCLANSF